MSDWIEEISSACTGHRAFFEWLVENMRPSTIVELGVDRGYSTFVFAEALAKNNQKYSINLVSAVYGIDWFEGDASSGYRNTLDEVNENIQKHNLQHIKIIKGDFNEIAKAWSRGIDILFIDGSHDYESVKRDFENWSQFVKPNGIILMHDIDVPNFCVRKYYEQITGYMKLEFNHSYGLGILTRDIELHRRIKIIVELIKKIIK